MFSFSHCGAILFRRLIERENFRARLHLFFHCQIETRVGGSRQRNLFQNEPRLAFLWCKIWKNWICKLSLGTFGGVESDDLNDAYFGYSVLFQSIRLILGETRKREKKFFHLNKTKGEDELMMMMMMKVNKGLLKLKTTALIYDLWESSRSHVL